MTCKNGHAIPEGKLGCEPCLKKESYNALAKLVHSSAIRADFFQFGVGEKMHVYIKSAGPDVREFKPEKPRVALCGFIPNRTQKIHYFTRSFLRDQPNVCARCEAAARGDKRVTE